MLRPLNPFERAAVVSNDYAPFNVVIAITLHNAPTPTILSQALNKLQHAHPLLRSHIQASGNQLWFEETTSPPPIPLILVDRQDERTWEKIVEQEMEHPFIKTEAPLLRVTYIQSEDLAELVLTAHHALIDGAAGTYLIDQLLSLCYQPKILIDKLPIRNTPNPIPKSHRGLKKIGQLGKFGFAQMLGEFSYRIANMGKRVPLVRHGGQGKIVTTTFSKTLTANLSSKCRRERITLNSVLNAAQLLAVNKILYAGENAAMQTFSFADLRPYLKPPVPPEDLGGLVTLFRIPVDVDGKMNFWDLAKLLHQKITVSLKRGDKFNAYLTSEGLLKMMTRLDKFRFGSSAINYSGVIQIAPHYGNIQVNSIHGFVSAYDLAPEFSSQARIFNDEIIWDFIYLDTDMDASTANQLVQEITSILENAVA